MATPGVPFAEAKAMLKAMFPALDEDTIGGASGVCACIASALRHSFPHTLPAQHKAHAHTRVWSCYLCCAGNGRSTPGLFRGTDGYRGAEVERYEIRWWERKSVLI